MKGTLLCIICIQPYSVYCTENNCIFQFTIRSHGMSDYVRSPLEEKQKRHYIATAVTVSLFHSEMKSFINFANYKLC